MIYHFRKFGYLTESAGWMFMRYFTCLFFCAVYSGMTHAQNAGRSEAEQICASFHLLKDSPYRGTNLLFALDWAKGKVLMANNTIVDNEFIYYNFDKVEQELFITTDFIRYYEVDRREYKDIIFRLHDSSFLYKHDFLIDKKDLFEVLVNNEKKYSLYKGVFSKIRRGAFTINSGAPIRSPGDLFVDIEQYYILFPGREFKKIFIMKKSAVEGVFEFSPDSHKVMDYLNQKPVNELEENDLKDLVLYLNKENG
jgi:hypothetical protein